MQPSRILPDLQCSLICEDIRQEVTGNFMLIGVLNFIRVPQVPITAGRLLVFNRWTAGFGDFTQSLRLLAPDQTTALAKNEVKFSLPDPAAHTINVAVFNNITFNAPGTYFVEVLVDDVMKLRYPITLVVTPPGQGQGQNQPPPAKPAA
jgi:hypothetical protein